jgi:hypothetical protein
MISENSGKLKSADYKGLFSVRFWWTIKCVLSIVLD